MQGINNDLKINKIKFFIDVDENCLERDKMLDLFENIYNEYNKSFDDVDNENDEYYNEKSNEIFRFFFNSYFFKYNLVDRSKSIKFGCKNDGRRGFVVEFKFRVKEDELENKLEIMKDEIIKFMNEIFKNEVKLFKIKFNIEAFLN